MTRARGRNHTGRDPVAVDSGEGQDIGMSDRLATDRSPIPGGDIHITNHETVRQRVPVPVADREYSGMMAHGVEPGPGTTQERAHVEQGANKVHPVVPKPVKLPERPAPIPVYVVEPAGGERPLGSMAGDSFTIPPAGSDPVRIAGRDIHRTAILLLCETAPGATFGAPRGVRIDHEVGNLTNGRGALVPTGASSYQKFDGFQDELFAVSTDASTVILSVINQYEVANAG